MAENIHSVKCMGRIKICFLCLCVGVYNSVFLYFLLLSDYKFRIYNNFIALCDVHNRPTVLKQSAQNSQKKVQARPPSFTMSCPHLSPRFFF